MLRRVIRRAIRFAYLLGVQTPVLPDLSTVCIDSMADAYPDLLTNRDAIVDILDREEGRFRSTLARGVQLLDTAFVEHPGQVPGDVAFQLHDTYGFPLEVTQEIAREHGVEVDVDGFDRLMDEQRRRAKEASRKGDLYADLTDFQSVLDRFGPSEFVGREEFESKSTVLAVVPGRDGTVAIILDRTPFYAESGGQVGDTGTIATDTGTAEVLDTNYALPGLHRHVARVVEGEIAPGQEATAAIDVERRDAIRRNHTGTHILHWALRHVLGDHVKQQGSLVAPDRLRFDFSHYEPLSAAQIEQIEDLANHEILSNDPVHHYETTKANAEQLGAIAFFGDKYGDIVRVLEAGRHSTELCGGTHVRALGDIGPVKIVREESIGSNLRRIEAVTGTGPIDRLRREEELVDSVAQLLNVPREDLVEGARKRLDEIKALRDEVKTLRRDAATGQSSALASQAVDGVVVARVDGVEREGLRDLAVAVRDVAGIRAVVLGSAPEGGGAALVERGDRRQRARCGRADRRRGESHQGRRRPGSAAGRRGWQGSRRPRRRTRSCSCRDRCPRFMRALGLDLGAKRIGVAVSDDDERVATPIDTVTRARAGRGEDHRAVGRLVEEWSAEVVVVGLPISLDGSIGRRGHGRARRGVRTALGAFRPRRDGRRTLHHGDGQRAVARAGRARQAANRGHRSHRGRRVAAVVARPTPAGRFVRVTEVRGDEAHSIEVGPNGVHEFDDDTTTRSSGPSSHGAGSSRSSRSASSPCSSSSAQPSGSGPTASCSRVAPRAPSWSSTCPPAHRRTPSPICSSRRGLSTTPSCSSSTCAGRVPAPSRRAATTSRHTKQPTP